MRTKRFLPLLTAASVLLLLGAGCGSAPDPVPAAPVGSERPQGAEADVDAAVDAYLDASAEEQATLSEEEADVSEMTAADAEVNAYGQAYAPDEF